MRAFHLIGVFIKGSFQRETAYRFHFATHLLGTILTLLASAGGLFVVFSNKQELNGWSFHELAMLLGVYLFILGVKNLVIGPGLEALSGLSGELWTGHFDYTLLKPIPLQFYISFRKWSLWSLFEILLSLVIIVLSFLIVPSESFSVGIVLFPATLLISMVLIYSVLLILASAAFWYLGTPLMWIFDSLIQTGRFPVGIYPGFFRLVLTWIIPVGFIVTVPAQALSGVLDVHKLWGGAFLAIVLFVGATGFFKASVRKYASASS